MFVHHGARGPKLPPPSVTSACDGRGGEEGPPNPPPPSRLCPLLRPLSVPQVDVQSMFRASAIPVTRGDMLLLKVCQSLPIPLPPLVTCYPPVPSACPPPPPRTAPPVHSRLLASSLYPCHLTLSPSPLPFLSSTFSPPCLLAIPLSLDPAASPSLSSPVHSRFLAVPACSSC